MTLKNTHSGRAGDGFFRLPRRLIGAAFMLFSLAVCGQTEDQLSNLLPTCTSCHGPNGISTNPEVPSLAGQHEDYIFDRIKSYQSPGGTSEIMRAMVGSLSDDDIIALAHYFASQPYVRNRQLTDAQKATRGKEVYLRVCQICHRDEGRSSSYPEYPLLAGQSLDYMQASMKQILSGERRVNIMKREMLALARPEQISDAIQFFASQEVDPSQVSTSVRNKRRRKSFMTSQ